MAESNQTVAQVFQFSEKTFIENIHVLPNGHLLLTTFAGGDLYTIDPHAAEPKAETVVTLSGSTGLTGIAPLGDGLYAVSGGIHETFSFAEGSMQLYIVSVTATADKTTGVVVGQSIPVPETRVMNGMTALPNRPHTVLSADSTTGRLIRIDTKSRAVEVAIADAALGPGESKFPIGVNGIRVRGGYVYYTNSALGTFGRFPIDDDGNNTGPVEVLARHEGVPGMGNAFDDFIFDGEGNAYVAMHSSTIVKITPEGVQIAFAGGGESTTFNGPTSAALANDGKSIYVSTGYGGQVVNVKI
ncbi:hypothetical protein B0H11DRAFT_430611 [Mycena galericulata]|nr:hypothetical protein B0H11DRAFT_430611 [Mycena galericulata]